MDYDEDGSGRRGYAYYSEIRTPRKPPAPRVTHTLLGVFGGMFLLELLVAVVAPTAFVFIFTINPLWFQQPWSLITSTVSHSLEVPTHILFNGFFLYFFGPTIENVIGWKRFLILFFGTGALSGILQVTLDPGPALGASGALMALLGVTLILTPNAKLIMFPLPVPLPLWVAGIVYTLLDVLGIFAPGDSIGHFAHLSGLAAGLVYGVFVKRDLERRGLRITRG